MSRPDSDSDPSSGATPAFSERIVRCPQCGGDSVYAPSNPWRPFCSERCRKIDLGAWANEEYQMPDNTPPDGLLPDEPMPRH
ncbi:DNA gyrase inhibitor YacG [Brachymonas chironomi]|uniref:DNA gyrase inhibitor YacG n=1 Tax=Brachymonas chironomi TaxID=491919 RepID=UPI00037B245A|nr:DNA gyrase inhibitor YacG [Brachymonas chironomi]